MIRSRLLPFLPRRSLTVVHECRVCGVTVEPAVDVCPCCDRRSIARYEIPRGDSR
ncbi:hypothetical protein ACFR9U_07210 [Halorientalis brevis]|uniref:Rubrerythrin-like domain-containing protein n=1 Tax=Halorientalis brevis TaxID=1126241 RepID=A0ABD6CB53_9EURY|nr:hypothetical protein [Halorientalis brevis]